MPLDYDPFAGAPSDVLLDDENLTISAPDGVVSVKAVKVEVSLDDSPKTAAASVIEVVRAGKTTAQLEDSTLYLSSSDGGPAGISVSNGIGGMVVAAGNGRVLVRAEGEALASPSSGRLDVINGEGAVTIHGSGKVIVHGGNSPADVLVHFPEYKKFLSLRELFLRVNQLSSLNSLPPVGIDVGEVPVKPGDVPGFPSE